MHTLTKLIESQHDWDLTIDAALYAYCVGIQDSSRFSPFFLLYNRHTRKAIDYEIKVAVNQPDEENNPNNANTIEDIIGELLDLRENYHQQAHRNIHAAQERQKMYFNAKHDSNHVGFDYVHQYV